MIIAQVDYRNACRSRIDIALVRRHRIINALRQREVAVLYRNGRLYRIACIGLRGNRYPVRLYGACHRVARPVRVIYHRAVFTDNAVVHQSLMIYVKDNPCRNNQGRTAGNGQTRIKDYIRNIIAGSYRIGYIDIASG